MDLVTLLRLGRKFLRPRSASPEYVLFQVTSRCNLHCTHCFLWEDTGLGWENTFAGANDMTLDEIRRLASAMPRFYFMNMTGGEPFLRPDLPEIVEIFYHTNRLRGLLIPTNGTVMGRIMESVTTILERCPRLALAVDISLDGIGEDHDRIRSSDGAYDRAVETLEALKELQRQFPHHLQIGVIISCMGSNQHSLDATYDHVRDHLRPDSISVALTRGTPRVRTEGDVDLKNYQAVTRRLEEDLRQRRLKGFRRQLLAPLTIAAKILMHREIVRTVQLGYQRPCQAARLNVVIYSNGDVYPCEVLGPERRIGNLRDENMDFTSIWRGNRRREIANWVTDSRCHCTHECHVPMNILVDHKRLLEVVGLASKL